MLLAGQPQTNFNNLYSGEKNGYFKFFYIFTADYR